MKHLRKVAGLLVSLLGGALLLLRRRTNGPGDESDLLMEDEQILEGFNRLGLDCIGFALVRRPDGTIVLIFVDDENRDLPPPAPQNPEVVGRSDPFGGTVKDLERFIVPSGRQPEGLNDPLPQPDPPGELTPELLAERRQRLDEQRRERFRYVVVTEEQGEGGPVCVIRVFDGDGQLISTVRREGAFVKVLPNDATGEKSVVTRQGGGLAFVLIDTVTGEVRASSGFALDGDDDIQDVNAVSGQILVFDQLLRPTRTRVRIFGPEGPPPRQVIEIPGTLVKGASVQNGATVKSVVTEFEGKIYNDLIEVLTGRRLIPVDARGLAQNPITGTFANNQFDQVAGEDRFIAAAYNADRDETEVRILDNAGRIVGTVVLRGRFVAAEVKQGQKEFVSRRRDGTAEVTLIDLLTGRTIQ